MSGTIKVDGLVIDEIIAAMQGLATQQNYMPEPLVSQSSGSTCSMLNAYAKNLTQVDAGVKETINRMITYLRMVDERFSQWDEINAQNMGKLQPIYEKIDNNMGSK